MIVLPIASCWFFMLRSSCWVCESVCASAYLHICQSYDSTDKIHLQALERCRVSIISASATNRRTHTCTYEGMWVYLLVCLYVLVCINLINIQHLNSYRGESNKNSLNWTEKKLSHTKRNIWKTNTTLTRCQNLTLSLVVTICLFDRLKNELKNGIILVSIFVYKEIKLSRLLTVVFSHKGLFF